MTNYGDPKTGALPSIVVLDNALPEFWQAMNERSIAAIDQHIPSLTDEDEAIIHDNAVDYILLTYGNDKGAADLALRTCRCGVRIDGFYEYVDHLKEVIRNL